jgi:hypothetical protein
MRQPTKEEHMANGIDGGRFHGSYDQLTRLMAQPREEHDRLRDDRLAPRVLGLLAVALDLPPDFFAQYLERGSTSIAFSDHLYNDWVEPGTEVFERQREMPRRGVPA